MIGYDSDDFDPSPSYLIVFAELFVQGCVSPYELVYVLLGITL